MLSPTDNSYSSPLPKPAAGGLLDDPSGTASTQPIANPKPLPSTQPLALAPAPSSPTSPIAAPTSAPPDATAPSAPAPVTPPPLATPDPLAFAPQTPTPAPVAASTVSPSPLTPSAPTPVPSDTMPTMSGGTLNPTPAVPTDPNGMPTGGAAPRGPTPVLDTGIGDAAPRGPTPTLDTTGGGAFGPFPTQDQIIAENRGEGPGNVGGGGNGLGVPAPVQAPVPIPTDANGMPSYSTTPTTPDNSLINSTITPGPATDRYAIAQKEYNDWVAQSDPQFQAQMRDANRYSAAAGRIGSGQATNSIGDIATQRENATRSARDNFLGNALTGSIDDAYKNVGIAQQQQGFQAGQQQTAFGQNVELQQLANSEQGQQYAQMMQSLGFNAQQIQQAFQNAYNVQQMSNSQDAQSFYQALEQEIQGSQGDPAQILAWISGQYARSGSQ